MAGGWAKDGAVQDQIDDSVGDAVRRIRDRLPGGESLKHCEQCHDEIPAPRREAIKGVRRCVRCQAESDRQAAVFTGYNRRGSKDSQLR